jgi:hypothetical protein
MAMLWPAPEPEPRAVTARFAGIRAWTGEFLEDL